jgi:hypothetical protein
VIAESLKSIAGVFAVQFAPPPPTGSQKGMKMFVTLRMGFHYEQQCDDIDMSTKNETVVKS